MLCIQCVTMGLLITPHTDGSVILANNIAIAVAQAPTPNMLIFHFPILPCTLYIVSLFISCHYIRYKLVVQFLFVMENLTMKTKFMFILISLLISTFSCWFLSEL